MYSRNFINNLPVCVYFAQTFFFSFFSLLRFLLWAREEDTELQEKQQLSRIAGRCCWCLLPSSIHRHGTTVLTKTAYFWNLPILASHFVPNCVSGENTASLLCPWKYGNFLINFYRKVFPQMTFTLSTCSPLWITWDAQSWLLIPYILLCITIYCCLIRTFWFDRSKKKNCTFLKRYVLPLVSMKIHSEWW